MKLSLLLYPIVIHKANSHYKEWTRLICLIPRNKTVDSALDIAVIVVSYTGINRKGTRDRKEANTNRRRRGVGPGGRGWLVSM